MQERDERELTRRLAQVEARLRVQEEPPTEYELTIWSGWIVLWLEDKDAYHRHARDRVLEILRGVR